MVSIQLLRDALPRAGAWLVCAAATSAVIANPPRILQVSASNSRSADSLIREPVAAPEVSVAEPPARTSRRSSFVPIAVPEEAAAPQSTPAPQLSPEPSFPAESASAPVWNVPSQVAQPDFKAAEPRPPLAPPKIEPPTPKVESPAVSYQPPKPSPQLPSTSQTSSPAMQAVAERAMFKAEQASAMAQRGMLYSAQTELVAALALIAQSLDVEEGNPGRAKALHAGLTALEEAREFARTRQVAATVDVSAIAAGHRTSLFRDNPDSAPTSPVIAQQQYFGFAQDQFAHAAGQVPAASQILYRLGRLQTALASHDADPLALHGPQAIVFHQAALATDRGNWLAANELGVLYARYGQLPAAKEMLLASVTLRPSDAGWQNLAAVHRRLGESDLAARADYERQALAKKGSSASGASQIVRWVDPKTFASSGASDVRWPAEVAAKPTPAAGATRK